MRGAKCIQVATSSSVVDDWLHSLYLSREKEGEKGREEDQVQPINARNNLSCGEGFVSLFVRATCYLYAEVVLSQAIPEPVWIARYGVQ